MEWALGQEAAGSSQVEASQVTDFDTFMASAIATSWCQHLCCWQHYLMLQERLWRHRWFLEGWHNYSTASFSASDSQDLMAGAKQQEQAPAPSQAKPCRF